MAENKKPQQHQDPEKVIEQSLNRFELFLEKNGKGLLIALGVIIIAVGGYFGYKYAYKAPQMDKAATAMFDAQYMFERDSFALALNGDASFDGFLAIADEYGSTPQGNLANHYAGICYLYLGEYQSAIDAFGAYSPVKESSVGAILTAQNYGMTGDAYIQLGNLEEGLKMYEKAAASSDNSATTPVYLKKAATVNEALGNKQKALEQYQSVKTNYPRSMQARDIDKFIAKVQQEL